MKRGEGGGIPIFFLGWTVRLEGGAGSSRLRKYTYEM